MEGIGFKEGIGFGVLIYIYYNNNKHTHNTDCKSKTWIPLGVFFIHQVDAFVNNEIFTILYYPEPTEFC